MSRLISVFDGNVNLTLGKFACFLSPDFFSIRTFFQIHLSDMNTKQNGFFFFSLCFFFHCHMYFVSFAFFPR